LRSAAVKSYGTQEEVARAAAREAAEAHAARMRERCPRNADLIKVEKLEAAD
jgi:hypothetical protein